MTYLCRLVHLWLDVCSVNWAFVSNAAQHKRHTSAWGGCWWEHQSPGNTNFNCTITLNSVIIILADHSDKWQDNHKHKWQVLHSDQNQRITWVLDVGFASSEINVWSACKWSVSDFCVRNMALHWGHFSYFLTIHCTWNMKSLQFARQIGKHQCFRNQRSVAYYL